MAWITKALWTFMVRHANKSTRKSFRTLVGSEELNGAELRRVLRINNESGAEEVEVADLGALHAFPPCQSGAALPQYWGLRLPIVNGEGSDLPRAAWPHS